MSRATDGKQPTEFFIDLRALHKVLAFGNGIFGCLNPEDAKKCSCWILELQRDVAALLVGELDGVLEPTAEQQRADTRLRCTLREAMPYFRWLGVRVHDKLAADTKTDADNGRLAKAKEKPSKRKAGVNARMLEMMYQNHEATGWPCTQWAKHLKCAKSSVVTTQAWIDLKMGRDRVKAERAQDRRRRPKGSDLKRD